MKTAVVGGATGLVGKQLLEKLLASGRYARVVALTRSPLSRDHEKLTNIVTRFDDLDNSLEGLDPDDVFCALGTTMRKAGSKEKFYEVDFQYPFNLAVAALGKGAQQYLLVSALGANKGASIYYNRVKGEVEEAISKVGFETVHIFRPSLLLGPRNEKRPGEDAAKAVYKILDFVIPQKYKAISGESVADFMIGMAARDMKGVFVHESRDMQRK